MREHLLNKKQPFGEVHRDTILPENIPVKKAYKTQLGSDRIVGNNGFNHAPPIRDNPNPSAQAQASAHHDNPFHWCHGR